jgi:replicative DNA helicase
MSLTEDLSDVIEFAEDKLFQLSNITQSSDIEPISNSIDDVLKVVQKIQNKEITMSGVPSGIRAVDEKTGGWKPTNFIIIAGRPSMGKTAMGLQLAQNSASQGYPVALFSLEMSSTEIATRFLAGVSGYNNMEISSARVDLDKLSKDCFDLSLLPIYIDDTPALSIFELRSKIKKAIVKQGIKLAIVDYLQLMHGEGQNREQEISSIARGLKAIAKEFNIPVIAMSQLNREVESRADKRPRLADLRESGAIEQDADIVVFVSRPFIYGMNTITIDSDELETKDLILFDIAKHRNGACFTLGLHHNDTFTRIT